MASSRSWKGSDYAEPPHGQSPEIKPPVEVMRHNPGYGIMGQLMQKRGIVGFLRGHGIGAGEKADFGHPHKVSCGLIASALSAFLDARAGRGREGFGPLDPFDFGGGRCLRGFFLVTVDLA
jgi:hypothetical protein